MRDAHGNAVVLDLEAGMTDSELSEYADKIEVESDIDVLVDAISEVMKDHLDRGKSKIIAKYEGRLLASLATLQTVCSELREIRVKR